MVVEERGVERERGRFLSRDRRTTVGRSHLIIFFGFLFFKGPRQARLYQYCTVPGTGTRYWYGMVVPYQYRYRTGEHDMTAQHSMT